MRLITLLFAATAVWTAAFVAHAQPRKPVVLVLDFDGNRGSLARSNVIRGISGHANFAKREDALELMRSRSLKQDSAEARQLVAEALGVDYVFWGRVRGSGGRARTEVRIGGRDGGQISAWEASAPGSNARHRDIQAAAKRALDDALNAAPLSAAPPQKSLTVNAPPVEASTDAGSSGDASGGLIIGPITKIDASSTAVAPSANSQPTTEENESTPKIEKVDSKTSSVPIATLLVGGGMRLRNATIRLELDNAERQYRSGIFGDLAAHLTPTRRAIHSYGRAKYSCRDRRGDGDRVEVGAGEHGRQTFNDRVSIARTNRLRSRIRSRRCRRDGRCGLGRVQD
ncbi:MAG: hypothetical protein R3A47_03965 [Polyangiales bacterium]